MVIYFQLSISHQDQIEELPLNAEVLGSNEHCPYSMIVVGNHFLGIQAHPEFSRDFAEALMLSRTKRIGQETVDAARATLGQATDEHVITQWITAFLRGTSG